MNNRNVKLTSFFIYDLLGNVFTYGACDEREKDAAMIFLALPTIPWFRPRSSTSWAARVIFSCSLGGSVDKEAALEQAFANVLTEQR
jgi:hypothetical protein